jgi:peroxiredoxin
MHALSDYADSKRIVVIFFGCDCPIAKSIAPRLASLAREFESQGVKFLAIDSNSQDSLSKLAQFSQTNDLPFPVLKDLGNVVADQFGAVRTPEVFLLDADRVVRYRGRVDDQYLVGKQRPHPTRDDLKLALQESLAGKPVSVPETEAVGCLIGRVPKTPANTSGAEPAVTYSQQISRLLQARCVSCHRDGEIAPFPLTSYDEVQGWGETIREVVEQERMPPWLADPKYGKFSNDCRLSEAEKQLIYDWLDAGAPEGDRSQLPEPRAFSVGWQITPPDQVIFIADQPVDVPAEGVVKYQHFLVDPGFKEDRWIKAAECRPGNRSVVHHIVVNFIPPGAKPRIGLNGATVGFAPGIPPVRMPEGMAMFVPAGSKLLFQMHYTPNGSPQQDRSSLGIVFADPKEIRHKVDSFGAANVTLDLPPGEADVTVKSEHRFSRPVTLLSMMPHMHLRGKSFRFEVHYPDGRSEILLDVPHYDFNWQLRYELAEPKQLPADTLLTCTAHFDNSADNPVNPDPKAQVRWGEQTWDEMMIGYFGAVSAADDPNSASSALVREDADAERKARGVLERSVEALGGQKRLSEHSVLSYKMHGKLNISAGVVDFDGDATLQPTANRMRLAIVGGGFFKFAIVLDGDHAWIKLNERVQDLPAEAVEEQRERMHAESVAQIYPILADPQYKLALIIDTKVGDRTAVGVRVRRELHRDVQLFFDTETWRLLKTETQINENGKDIRQETFLEDYAQIDEVWRPRRSRIRWDGADRALREMSEIRSTDQPEADAFAKP